TLDVEVPFQEVSLEEAAVASSSSYSVLPATESGTLGRDWLRISRLSPRQRAAFLLRTYPGEKEALVFLFIDVNAATLAEAAVATSISTEQLLALRGGPPLTDEKIGELLGIAASRVRSYRQEARRR